MKQAHKEVHLDESFEQSKFVDVVKNRVMQRYPANVDVDCVAELVQSAKLALADQIKVSAAFMEELSGRRPKQKRGTRSISGNRLLTGLELVQFTELDEKDGLIHSLEEAIAKYRAATDNAEAELDKLYLVCTLCKTRVFLNSATGAPLSASTIRCPCHRLSLCARHAGEQQGLAMLYPHNLLQCSLTVIGLFFFSVQNS